MTIEEIEKHPKTTLSPAMVGQLLGIDPFSIRYMARTNPALLGFKTVVYQTPGSTYFHCKIPKDAFINWYRGRGDGNGTAVMGEQAQEHGC